MADRPNGNVGLPMSPLAQAALRGAGYQHPGRTGARCNRSCFWELATATVVSCACEAAEHRPMLCRFPEHEDEVVYWTVHHLDVAIADQVLSGAGSACG
ncbi:MAG: hypothetical protein R2838_18915 [Caldilineaceae bacterium]